MLTKGRAWLPKKLVTHSGEHTGGEVPSPQPPTGKEVAATGKLAFNRGPMKVGVLSFSGPASHKQRALLFPTLLRGQRRGQLWAGCLPRSRAESNTLQA